MELVADFVGGVTTPAAEVTEATLGDATDQDEEMLEPLHWDGPLGQKGESLSLSQLRVSLPFFGHKIAINVNKLTWDFSLVCEFLLYCLHHF